MNETPEQRSAAILQKNQSRKEELQALVGSDVDEYQDVLDDIVRDCFDKKASSLNNLGADEQIAFLIGEIGIAHLMTELGVRTASNGRLIGK